MRYHRAHKVYSCSDGFCGAYDCVRCRGEAAYHCEDDEDDEDREEETSRSRIVTARKARFVGMPKHEIRPGDRVRVTSGFTYKVGGPRLRYFRRRARVAKGPAWTEES